MKIGSHVENTLITNHTGTAGKYKLAASGKAFTLLSNSLYSYKVKAVVREIGCNAFDAHIDAKNTSTPFEVQLPSPSDPHFIVRDYGIGLSDDEFIDVYGTYFGSTKADRNDHTGGLGLGSKTPFIMSKSFTVWSHYNGFVSAWHSYINDNGEPDVIKLSTTPTTEPNGLLVKVPIGQGVSETERNALFKEFQEEAQTIYQYFDVLPKVTYDGKPFEIIPALDNQPLTTNGDKIETIELGAQTGIEVHYLYMSAPLVKNPSSARANTFVHVKMGNVVYPFDLSKVRSLERFGGNVATLQSIIKFVTETTYINSKAYPLTIDVPMGAVTIAPSREALEITNITELTVINAISLFITKLRDKFQKQIDNAATLSDVYTIIYGLPKFSEFKFSVKGVKGLESFDPTAVRPVWRFGDTSKAVNYKVLREFKHTPGIQYRYRAANRRAIYVLGDDQAELFTMYGHHNHIAVVVLVDTVYKGELRNWINENVQGDRSIVIVSTDDKKVPLTAKQMEPFYAEGSKNVIKLSEFKHQPTIKAGKKVQSSAITKEEVLIADTIAARNFFTTGMSHKESLDDLINNKFIEAGNTEPTVFIACTRISGVVMVEMETVDAGNVKKYDMVRLTSWSRASNLGDYNTHCTTLDTIFRRLPKLLFPGQKKNVIALPDGNGKTKLHPVKFMVMTEAGYKQHVTGSPHRYIMPLWKAIEYMADALPEDIVVHKNAAVSYNHYELDRHLPHSCQILSGFGLLPVLKYVEDMGDLINGNGTRSSAPAVNGEVAQLIKSIGVDMLLKDTTALTHLTKTVTKSKVHDLSYGALVKAIHRAHKQANVPGIEVLVEILHNLGDTAFTAMPQQVSYRSNSAATYVGLFNTCVALKYGRTYKLNQNSMANAIIDQMVEISNEATAAAKASQP